MGIVQTSESQNLSLTNKKPPDVFYKSFHIYVDTKIEFDIDLREKGLTCGWLLSETTRRYNLLKTHGKRKRIVTLKSSD